MCFASLACLSLSLCRRRPKNLPAEDCRPLLSMPITRVYAQCCRPGSAPPDVSPVPLLPEAAPSRFAVTAGVGEGEIANSYLYS